MARSKRKDETGQANDNRSIAIEKMGDYLDNSGYYSGYKEPAPEATYQKEPEHLTHNIVIPEHLKSLLVNVKDNDGF